MKMWLLSGMLMLSLASAALLTEEREVGDPTPHHKRNSDSVSSNPVASESESETHKSPSSHSRHSSGPAAHASAAAHSSTAATTEEKETDADEAAGGAGSGEAAGEAAGGGGCQVKPRDDWKSMSADLGMKNQPWLPIAFEIETYFTEEDKGDDEMKNIVIEGFKSVETNGDCNSRMFQVSTDHSNLKGAWVWEKEISAGSGANNMWEMSSPVELDQNEAELAARQTGELENKFTKETHVSVKNDFGAHGLSQSNPPGFHMHVHGKCLLTDERRLVALILVWDKYFGALQKKTKSDKHVAPEHRKFANTFALKNPPLYEFLKGLVGDTAWEARTGDGAEAETKAEIKKLEEGFAKHEMDATDINTHDPHNGYRRYVLNVCHLLEVKCSFDWDEKNNVPKFGGLEFRGFDAVMGENLRLMIMLLQRTVQFFCGLSLPDLHKLASGFGGGGLEPSNSANELLHQLGMKDEANMFT